MIIKLFILWVNNYFAALIGNDISCVKPTKEHYFNLMKNTLIEIVVR